MRLQAPLGHGTLGHHTLDHIGPVLGYSQLLVQFGSGADLVDIGVDVAPDVLPRVNNIDPTLSVLCHTARQRGVFACLNTPS